MAEALKAYTVSDDDECAVVVFASSGIAARRMGANSLDMDFQGVSCRRSKDFDQYTPGPVPIDALRASGWWFDCACCGTRVHGEDGIAAYGTVYCDDHKLAPAISAKVLQDVAELPDRTSPEEWPDAMLVTAIELRRIVEEAVYSAGPQVDGGSDAG